MIDELYLCGASIPLDKLHLIFDILNTFRQIFKVSDKNLFICELIYEYVLDRFGRRPVILSASLVFLVGAMVMGTAPEKVTLLVGRIVVGIGIGMTYSPTFSCISSFLYDQYSTVCPIRLIF